jgi:hypothetical protein
MLLLSVVSWLHFIGVAVLIFGTCETTLASSGIAIETTLAFIATLVMHRFICGGDERKQIGQSLAVFELMAIGAALLANIFFIVDYVVAIGRCLDSTCQNTDALLFTLNTCVADISVSLLVTVTGVLVTLVLTEIAFFVAIISANKHHSK